MAKSAPETFKKKLREAEQLYDEAKELLSGRDKDGFTKLIQWNDIDEAVYRLCKMQGMLEAKIEELNKDGSQKNKYVDMLQKIEEVTNELCNKRIERNKR